MQLFWLIMTNESKRLSKKESLWFMLLALRRPKWLYIPWKFEEHLDARFVLSFASSHSYAYIVLLKPSHLCPYLDISINQLDQCQYLNNCAPTLPLTQH